MSDEAQFESRLLDIIQRRVPLIRQPYAQIARQLACDEPKVLEALAALRGPRGLIREISGLFDAGALGYRQVLAALRLPADAVDEAGRLVAAHPGVSHCYSRTGSYNLWFTLATSPASSLGPGKTVEFLAQEAAAEAYLVLPATRKYKLRMHLASRSQPDVFETPKAIDKPGEPARSGAAKLSEAQICAIRALQIDLPNCSDPFASISAEAGLDADMLLVHAADLLAAGYMRRYAAVLHHRRAGAEANVLVAWRVSEPAADAAGAKCAQQPAVSHCYLRPTAEDWPYGLYTMIHGRSRQDCRMTIEEIAAATHLQDRAELWTNHEYKKQRIGLFAGEETAWEEKAQQAS